MIERKVVEELFQTANPNPASEWRRDTSRRIIRESVQLRRSGDTREFFASTIDVAPTSLGLVCREQLAPGERVDVKCGAESAWEPFEVKHCSPLISGFKIGLQAI